MLVIVEDSTELDPLQTWKLADFWCFRQLRVKALESCQQIAARRKYEDGLVQMASADDLGNLPIEARRQAWDDDDGAAFVHERGDSFLPAISAKVLPCGGCRTQLARATDSDKQAVGAKRRIEVFFQKRAAVISVVLERPQEDDGRSPVTFADQIERCAHARPQPSRYQPKQEQQEKALPDMRVHGPSNLALAGAGC